MSAEVRPFLFDGEQLVRALDDHEGAPWFVGIDVCHVLGIRKYRDAIARLEEDERGSVVVDTLGGKQSLSAVSESGLYALIFRSRKPEAQRFRKWVTGEVLPALRQTGQYAMKPSADSELPDFPNWPMDLMRTRKGVMDSYRQIYGVSAAQWIAPQLGFPTPPPEMIEHGRQFELFRLSEVPN